MKGGRDTYYRGKKPWRTEVKRVCCNCTSFLSPYNKDTMCAPCEQAIPLNKRPYRDKF